MSKKKNSRTFGREILKNMGQTLSFKDVTEENMTAVAEAIAPHIKSGTVLLDGEMGAGKTTLIKRLVRLLGSADEATSPTFSIVNQYLKGDGSPIYHFDFYRIDDPREAFDMGYEEYFYSGALCLVEWGEKVTGLLPESAARITIRKTSAGRDIDFQAD